MGGGEEIEEKERGRVEREEKSGRNGGIGGWGEGRTTCERKGEGVSVHALTLSHTLHTASPKQTRLPSISGVKMSPNQPSELGVKRRTKLPCPVVDIGDFSLWSFLRKNIGQNSHQM